MRLFDDFSLCIGFSKSVDRNLVRRGGFSTCNTFCKTHSAEQLLVLDGVPNGSRTHVDDVRGRCPGPLDDGNAGLYVTLCLMLLCLMLIYKVMLRGRDIQTICAGPWGDLWSLRR